MLAAGTVLPVGAAGHPGEDLAHRVDVLGEGHLVGRKLIEPESVYDGMVAGIASLVCL